jgi:hypothetical protein
MNPLDCEIDNDERTCPTCGWIAPARHVRRNCPPKLSAFLNQSIPWWAWGTWLAVWLKTWGVTPRLVAWTVQAKDCGCQKRELVLNVAGMRFAQGCNSLLRLAIARARKP